MATSSVAKTKGLVALFKRGWNEIPSIVGSTGLALIGVCFGVYGCYNVTVNKKNIKKYRDALVVVRPDDPLAARIRRD